MKVIYTNELEQSIEFKYSYPFFLETIEGLGFENEINTMKITGWDGNKTINDSLNSRDISITGTIIANKKDDLNNFKLQLLKTLNPKLQGKIIINKKGVESRKIECKVNSITWGKETIKTQQFIVRLYCENPYLTNVQDISKNVAYWTDDFLFPVELVESGIEMGHRAESLIVNVKNNGDIETGMTIKFKAKGSLVNPLLFNVDTREYMKIITSMKAGDVITITTNQGNKRVVLTSSQGMETDIFNRIDSNSKFLQLYIGDNLFRYDADKNINNLEVSIIYVQKYLGV